MSTLARNIKRRQIAPAGERLREATVRQFDGGWNEVDSDLNLSSRYAKKLVNVFRAPDGSNRVRWGTKLLASFSGMLSNIVDGVYYRTYAIVVDEDGRVGAANAAGQTFLLFDNTIAASLPGSPAGWSHTSFVSFNEFNGELIDRKSVV